MNPREALGKAYRWPEQVEAHQAAIDRDIASSPRSRSYEFMKRPFHFMVSFWGKRYRDYFVDLFLPSMMAANNLPLLQAEDGHRFFIATPRDDWQAIKALPIMQRLRNHAQPTWVEVNAQPENGSTDDEHARYAAVIRHMGICQRTVLEAGYHPAAYGSFHLPDTLISDGMIASLLQSARAGYQLVLCPALRQTEEAVLAEIEGLGLWPSSQRPSATAKELRLTPRLAADLAVRHLHPEMAVFEEGPQARAPLPPFRFWRMPQGRGILLHTLFIVPVLMDYSIVAVDHTACLDHEAIENVYVSTNFRSCRAVHVVQDSDEFMILSVTPREIDHSVPVPASRHRSALRRHYDQLRDIRRSYEFYVLSKGDVIRHNLFATPVRWHGQDLDDVWMQAECRIERLIAGAVGDYYGQSSSGDAHELGRRHLNWRILLLDIPLFEIPSLLRGLLLRPLLQLPPLRRALMRLKDRRVQRSLG
jgi:hypothetical protein